MGFNSGFKGLNLWNSQNQTAPAKIDIIIFYISTSKHNKCHRSALSAKVENVIPTKACFPHFSSSASIRNYSLPHISHTADLMTGE